VNAAILIAEVTILMLGGAVLILAAQRRAAARPRPGDAIVTAVFTVADYPDRGAAEVAVAIANPGGSPVLVGLSPRRRGWPGRGMRATVPSRTTRRRYRADRQVTVGAVPPRSIGRLTTPVPVRPCRLAVVIGQPDGRLRVVNVPVAVRRDTRRQRAAARQRGVRGGPGATTPPSSFSFLWPR
jgi:hypothetical protein